MKALWNKLYHVLRFYHVDYRLTSGYIILDFSTYTASFEDTTEGITDAINDVEWAFAHDCL